MLESGVSSVICALLPPQLIHLFVCVVCSVSANGNSNMLTAFLSFRGRNPDRKPDGCYNDATASSGDVFRFLFRDGSLAEAWPKQVSEAGSLTGN